MEMLYEGDAFKMRVHNNCLERKSWTETRCRHAITYIELIFSRGLQRLWRRRQV